MATINNLIGGAGQSAVIRNNQNQMNELRNQFKNNEIDSKEYREKADVLKEQLSNERMAAVAAGVNTANNVSELFTYMNNSSGNGAPGIWGGGTFDSSVFIQSGGELANLQAMNSARIGIENRARSLVSEIGRDRARGFDVSDRQEALSNLTGNLDILNRNLNSSIDKALSDNGGKREGNFVDVVGRIKDSLAPAPPAPATEGEPAGQTVGFGASEPTEPAHTPEISKEVEQPSFAPPAAFEGSASEQIVAASEAQDPDEMSIASQIASNAQSEHAESVDIMSESSESIPNSQNEIEQANAQPTIAQNAAESAKQEQIGEAPEAMVEAGLTPANV